MKWTKPSEGKKRVKKKFCWLPKSDSRVVYWLEFVYVLQRYEIDSDGIFVYERWEDEKILTKEQAMIAKEQTWES